MFEILESGNITSPKQYIAGGANVGIKTDTDELDLGILWSESEDTICSGVFSSNSIVSHSITASKSNLMKNNVRGVVANSGCANCSIGDQGLIDATDVIKLTADYLNADPDNFSICSTGIIGEELPMALIRKNISRVNVSIDGGNDFAKSILTTDTKTKEVAVSVKILNEIITIGGCAKGVGMIHPNMATMLAFITTDAKLESNFQDKILKETVNKTFNQISVDGDQSTNDTVLFLSNGASDSNIVDASSENVSDFIEAFEYVCEYLAKELVSDGEGSNHLIECEITRASSLKSAKIAARSVVSSSLIKSMVHGRDPNWGRVMMAVGKSQIEINEDKIDVFINDIHIAHEGKAIPFSKESVITSMNQKEIKIRIDLNIGNYNGIAWGCDLTEEYVIFNSAYST
jgi:glutamate N-acetyltransferase/amino-acid N-acetyltransferase